MWYSVVRIPVHFRIGPDPECLVLNVPTYITQIFPHTDHPSQVPPIDGVHPTPHPAATHPTAQTELQRKRQEDALKFLMMLDMKQQEYYKKNGRLGVPEIDIDETFEWKRGAGGEGSFGLVRVGHFKAQALYARFLSRDGMLQAFDKDKGKHTSATAKQRWQKLNLKPCDYRYDLIPEEQRRSNEVLFACKLVELEEDNNVKLKDLANEGFTNLLMQGGEGNLVSECHVVCRGTTRDKELMTALRMRGLAEEDIGDKAYPDSDEEAVKEKLERLKKNREEWNEELPEVMHVGVMVMDCKAGNLANLKLAPRNLFRTLKLGTDLSTALRHLHKFCKLMHLDLKFENLMVCELCRLYLIDFDHSKGIETGSTILEPMGTQNLAPPQFEYEHEEDSQFSERADVFMFVVMIHMLLRFLATSIDDETRHYKKFMRNSQHIVKGLINAPLASLRDKIYPEIQSLLKRCFNVLDDARPSIDVVCREWTKMRFEIESVRTIECLSHPDLLDPCVYDPDHNDPLESEHYVDTTVDEDLLAVTQGKFRYNATGAADEEVAEEEAPVVDAAKEGSRRKRIVVAAVPERDADAADKGERQKNRMRRRRMRARRRDRGASLSPWPSDSEAE